MRGQRGLEQTWNHGRTRQSVALVAVSAVGRVFLVCLLYLLTPQVSWGQAIQVKVNLLPKGSWQPEEVTLIQTAAEKAFRRLAEAKVANCAYRNSSKENKDKLRKIWGNQIPVINKSRQVDITIHKKELEKNVLGRAKVDVASVDRSQFKIQNMEIDLSQDAMYSFLKTKPSVDRKDLWVNVIAHEVAHNLGHRHGSGGTWSSDYPGYFVTEIGFCAMSNGEHGSKP